MASINDVPPDLPELFIDERNGKYLLLNPRGPHWLVGSKLVAGFASLCNGARSVLDIACILDHSFDKLTESQVIAIADSLLKSRFFEDGAFIPIRPLSHIALNITKRCNLRCPFCYYDSSLSTEKAADQELTTAEWAEIAASVANINPHANIFVSGGEPFLRSDLVEIIMAIAGQGFPKITLATNGTLVTPELAQKLAVIPQLLIQLSIDSIVPQEDEQLRGSGHLQKALSALWLLKDAGAKVKVSATLTQVNKANIWRLNQFFAERGIPSKYSLFFVAGSRSKKNAPELALDADEIWGVMLDGWSRTGLTDIVVSASKLLLGPPRKSCGVGFGAIAINPDGSMSPCNHLTTSSFALGNIRSVPVRNLLEIGYQRYGLLDVDRFTHSSCPACHVRYFCGGDCRASAYHCYGDLEAQTPNCLLFQRYYIECLWVDVMGPLFSVVNVSHKASSAPTCVGARLHAGGGE
jgi:AdoMet-dependent heme synthase